MKVLLMQDFQTAASVLMHRLPHSAKPHPRILPQRGISMKKYSDSSSILMIIAGIILLIWPGGSLRTLAIVGGIFLLLEGISLLAGKGIKEGQNQSLIGSIVLIILGILLLTRPGESISMIMFIIGLCFVISAVSYIFNIRNSFGNRNMNLINAVLMLVFGIIIMAHPFSSAAAAVKVVAVFLLIDGVMNLVSSR
ncbi:MAG: DUF308 domain-containing protein [Lachnospiraceae bacterium]|nr:DUF308 domain-containing protein [Lachnospiraceae bacterium]MCI1422155.1 DUF308 domain-containing protein [Lachnospiraceae bacterium]